MWRTNLKIVLLTLGVVTFYTIIAHVIPQLQSEVPEELSLGGASPEQLVAAGERVFNGAGGCTACHGLGTRAPNLLTDFNGQGAIGARCGGRKPGMDCKAYLYESLTSPSAFIVPGFEPIMPDMRRQLAEDQIWAVVAFLQSQGGEVTVTAADIPPTPAAGAGAQAAGPAPSATMDPRQLITENGCNACHQLDGTGGGIGPSFDHMGGRVSADHIRRGILDPNAEAAKGFEKMKGTMPPIFGQKLSGAQVEALVQFLAARK